MTSLGCAAVSSLFLASVLGCGDNAAPTVTVTVAFGEPSLAVFSTDDGLTWSHPDLVGEHTYVFEVKDRFEFTAVAELTGGGSWAQQLKARYSDGNRWTLAGASDIGALREADQAPPSLVYARGDCRSFTGHSATQVTGTLLQSGLVSFAGECKSSSAAFPFEFDGASTPHDLIATSPLYAEDARLFVLRGIDTSSAVDVGNIDVTAGAALVPLNVDIESVEPSAPVTVDALLRTQTDLAPMSSLMFSDGSHPHALVAPMAALASTDTQFVELHSAFGGGLDRAVRFTVGEPEATHLVMLSAPTVAVTDGVAALSQPLESRVGEVDLTLTSLATEQTVLEQVTWTKSWLDTMPGAQLSFDSSIDGFPDHCIVDTTAAHQWRFSVRSESVGVAYKTMTTGTVEPASVGSAGGRSRLR